MHLSRPLSIALLTLALAGVAAAQDGTSLQQHMGATEFHQSGLDKLSPQELAHLQHWLAQHAAQLAAAVPASAASSAKVAARQPAAASARADRDVVQSRIAGSFTGWQPGSVLQLANGQHWRVVDDSSLTVTHPQQTPAVTIRPGLIGGWNLKVEGYNTRARVEPAN